jgi:hypothetical protein
MTWDGELTVAWNDIRCIMLAYRLCEDKIAIFHWIWAVDVTEWWFIFYRGCYCKWTNIAVLHDDYFCVFPLLFKINSWHVMWCLLSSESSAKLVKHVSGPRGNRDYCRLLCTIQLNLVSAEGEKISLLSYCFHSAVNNRIARINQWWNNINSCTALTWSRKAITETKKWQ